MSNTLNSTDNNPSQKRTAPEDAAETAHKRVQLPIRHKRPEADRSSPEPAKGSSWQLVLGYLTWCDKTAVDEKLATEVASIVSAMRGITIHPSDVIASKRRSHVTVEVLKNIEDPFTAWWRHKSINITMSNFLKPDAEEDLDQELERRGISIKSDYEVPEPTGGPTDPRYDPVTDPERPWRVKADEFPALRVEGNPATHIRLTSVAYESLSILSHKRRFPGWYVPVQADQDEEAALKRLLEWPPWGCFCGKQHGDEEASSEPELVL